jgi:toxin ParE1/3/4
VEYQVIWSPNAIKCLHYIGVNIVKRDSIINANKVVNKIKKRVGRLSTFPEVGRIVPEFKELGLHEVFVLRKRVIYEIIDSDVNVVAIVEDRMEIHTLDADLLW